MDAAFEFDTAGQSQNCPTTIIQYTCCILEMAMSEQNMPLLFLRILDRLSVETLQRDSDVGTFHDA